MLYLNQIEMQETKYLSLFLLFVFSPGDVVAPLGAGVIGDLDCEEDTRQQPQVNRSQLPGIWSFMMLRDTKPPSLISLSAVLLQVLSEKHMGVPSPGTGEKKN